MSFRIHTSDGKTVNIDLSDPEQAKFWIQRLKDPDFQQAITGIHILHKCNGKFRCRSCNHPIMTVCKHCDRTDQRAVCDKSVQFSLPRPEGFGQMYFHVEKIEQDVSKRNKGGEKITCFVDDIRATVLGHAAQPSVRISLLKTGKQRYNPMAE